jgi:hypothetical protein
LRSLARLGATTPRRVVADPSQKTSEYSRNYADLAPSIGRDRAMSRFPGNWLCRAQGHAFRGSAGRKGEKTEFWEKPHEPARPNPASSRKMGSPRLKFSGEPLIPTGARSGPPAAR